MSVDALVLAPGLGLGSVAWQPTLDALRVDAATAVHRLPGYGAPAGPEDDLHPRALAGRLIGAWPEAWRRVVLLGHSASCQVVAHAARAAADRVAGLVLVGPTTDPRATTWPRLAGRWLATARHETPRQVPSLARQYHRTTVRSIVRAMDVARTDRILDPLSGIQRPVLVVRGRHDRICPEDWAGSVAGAGGPGSLLATLPRGAHMVPLTHGRLLAPEIERFVGEVGSPRR